MAKRFILRIHASNRTFTIEDIDPANLQKDTRENYSIFWGESLAQYLLRQNPGDLVITRGPLTRFPANKATVGYISPLTGVPHYSFVGGQGFREIWYLGLDAVVFTGPLDGTAEHYVKISGRMPNIQVQFISDESLPRGQRSAYYYLVSKELDGQKERGSVFTLGYGAYHGYRSANVAVEAMYHAGRGGAGQVMRKFARALVLASEDRIAFEPEELPMKAFQRLEKYGSRLGCKDAGTITKLAATGKDPAGKNTLPAWNATGLGYSMADIGGQDILLATREGKAGCYWCPVSCRHYHTVPVDYAPDGEDLFLDDFEPAYAIFAMLGIEASEDTKEAKIQMIDEVNRELFLPVEQLGCDVIDIGLGIAALYEGISKGLIPLSDVPDFLHQKEDNSPLEKGTTSSNSPLEKGARGLSLFGSIEKTHRVLELLEANDHKYRAIRCLGGGPQALVEAYPEMRDSVFTCGANTLGNPGHCNKLWTFLMPFSRFFGHYSGQIYKVPGDIPENPDQDALQQLFSRVIDEMLRREYFGILCNTLSCCAFGFVIFSEGGGGVELSRDDLLVEVLRFYGIETSREELIHFAQNFWAQSIDLKIKHGWEPPSADQFPDRVFEAVSQAISHPPERCKEMMDLLIEEWKRQAKQIMSKYGYEMPW
jgi:aldehyde:ferredoxin oxidoreductase